MSTIQALKGFSDVLPAQVGQWQAVERIAREVSLRYDFHEIRTPVLESTTLFHRGVGETSDIVSKETYTFGDRDGDSVTLRPEGTAGVARAVIEGGLLNDQGARAKVYYLSSNFRHENTQRGRLRQHHQFGVEAFGVVGPEQDVECIQLQMDFYARCGLRDLSLRINSLGDRASKAAYRSALLAFLTPMRATLSDDSQRRLDSNPLRILDSKDPRDVAARAGAPAAADSLSDASQAHIARVTDLLRRAGVPFTLDGTLVRGFDYYTDTLWEVVAGGLGAQNAIGGGGRYDNLVEQIGGRPTPGVGFGSGIERLLLALAAQNVVLPVPRPPLVWLMHHGPAAFDANIDLARQLRAAGFRVDLDLSGRAMKGQFKVAERAGAAFSLTRGDTELADGTVMLKNFATREQESVPLDRLTDTLGLRIVGEADESQPRD